MNVRAFRSRLVVASLMIAPLLAACSRGPAVVGKWTTTQTAGTSSVIVEATFQKEGTYTINTTAKGGPASANIVQNGTYTVKDDMLTLTPGSTTMNGRPFNTASATPPPQKFKVEGSTLTLGTDRPGGGVAFTKVP